MQMDGWDWALVVAASYVAVMALVRLVAWRRDQLIAELQSQAQSLPSRADRRAGSRK